MIARNAARTLAAMFLATAAAVAGPAATVSAAPAGAADYTEVHVWASDVNVRNAPSGTAFEQCKSYPSRANCQVVAAVSRTTVTAYCQKVGETVSDAGYSSRWWTYLKSPSGQWGWVNNVYITGDEHLAHVADCGF
ncbi:MULTISPECIES: SH3 domain-containing protein [Streptomyces]|uniref:SH3 domain-containing protein n=1 Tax=Streptomyces TaxID=1883 RepID=UPI0007E0BAF0|nr:hypothetical protein A4V12_29475 [Streptomyces noursei]